MGKAIVTMNEKIKLDLGLSSTVRRPKTRSRSYQKLLRCCQNSLIKSFVIELYPLPILATSQFLGLKSAFLPNHELLATSTWPNYSEPHHLLI